MCNNVQPIFCTWYHFRSWSQSRSHRPSLIPKHLRPAGLLTAAERKLKSIQLVTQNLQHATNINQANTRNQTVEKIYKKAENNPLLFKLQRFPVLYITIQQLLRRGAPSLPPDATVASDTNVPCACGPTSKVRSLPKTGVTGAECRGPSSVIAVLVAASDCGAGRYRINKFVGSFQGFTTVYISIQTHHQYQSVPISNYCNAMDHSWPPRAKRALQSNHPMSPTRCVPWVLYLRATKIGVFPSGSLTRIGIQEHKMIRLLYNIKITDCM